MLAQTAQPFDSDEHYFEPKWDGMRCIAYIAPGKLELQNRNLTNVTKSYPELKTITEQVDSRSSILDGEIVVLERGLPSFDLLQNRFGVVDPIQIRILAGKIPTTYIAFDLLHLNGKDLVDRPLSVRRERLAGIIMDSPHILLSQYVAGKGKAYFRNAIKLGFEGAMAKRSESIYQIGTRSEDWLKLKQIKTIDCVIAGYTVGTGSRSSSFGALVLSAYGKDGKLKHLGNVGTGFSDTMILRIMKLLKPILVKSKTVPGEVKAPAAIVWVKPQFVAEVGFMQMTREGKLRLPRFQRLRVDKLPSDCVI
jgi:bifunctional non-homologous end joining protein LigD